MTRRTSPDDARLVFDAADLEDLVEDKRAGWRASGAKARRRQRRYKALLTQQILRTAPLTEEQDDLPGDSSGL